MKRTDAIQALRERFESYDEDRCVLLYKEEAAALGVFDKADDDWWIEWGGGKHEADIPLGISCREKVDVKFRSGLVDAWGDAPSSWHWDHDCDDWDIIAYRIHKED